MRHGREELSHVHLQEATVAAHELLRAPDRGMLSLGLAAGIGVEDHAALEDGFEHVDECMVHDLVAASSPG